MIPAGECEKCGLEHPRCHGHKHRDGETLPCFVYPIRGATVCKNHGGMAPQVRAKAAQRVAEREAAAQAQQAYPRRRPSEILLDALHKADAMAQQAAAEGWPDADVLAQRAATLAQTALNRDLEASEERLSEEQGRMLAETVRRILARLDLTAEQQQLVPIVVPQEFRAAEVPESGPLRNAVDALMVGFDVGLAERQSRIVVDAWRRAIGTLRLDQATLDRVTALFVDGCCAGAEQPAGDVEADAEPVA